MRLAELKRPYEPIKVELEGLQVICSAAMCACTMLMGQTHGDDLVVGVLVGMLVGSWLVALLMTVQPRATAAVLRLGWAVRVHVIEAGTRHVTAACLRVYDAADRLGWVKRCRRLRVLCFSSQPAVIARQCHARVCLGVRMCHQRLRSLRLREELSSEVCLAVIRCRLDEAYCQSQCYAEEANAIACNGDE